MEKSKVILLQLLRVALGNEDINISLPNDVLWQEVFVLAVKQGVVNIAYDGLQMLMDTNPRYSFGFDSHEMENLRYKWIGYGLSAEKTYQQYVSTVGRLARLYRMQGFQMVLFKGYSLSGYYPNPSHRPVGDIDIAIINEKGEWSQRQADELFRSELGINVIKSKNSHHSYYTFQGLKVENHYEFSNTYRSRKKDKEFEAILQSVCVDSNQVQTSVYGDMVFASPTFNALFLMSHLASHFCSTSITLRQLCDFMLFVERDYEKVDWKYVRNIYRDYGIDHFARVIDGVLVQYFHAKRSIFDDGVRLRSIESRVIKDTFDSREYNSFISRILRYPYFSWKYRLVRNQSWIRLIVWSIKVHLFHKEDLIEESI